MCGTGRFLLPLLEEGLDVHEFDASDHMLQALHTKAGVRNLEAKVWKGFVEDLNCAIKYKLIFIPVGSFGLITDSAQAELALKAIYNHLDEDGVFVFETETLASVLQQGVWQGSVWLKPNGQKIISSSLTVMTGDICNIIGKYELVETNRIIHTEIEEYNLMIYEPDRLIRMLESVGFGCIRTVKAFTPSSSPSNQDESIVYECRK
ncbi:Class I SAM-dependent methyltransferase [Rickettsiales endosymbiont of Paramecium tredecaurelia]|nr:Class I SAM-dependent methyltransferase [Candidatus Sarmatiella mevalonica]